MDTIAIAEQNLGRIRKQYPAFSAIASRYRDDAAFRRRVDSGDTAGILRDLGVQAPPGVEVRFAPNTPATFHVVLPPDPNLGLSDESLSTLAAGGKSAGSLGTAGSVGTATGTVSTAGSVSTSSSVDVSKQD